MEWRQCVGFPDFEVSERGDVRRLTQGGRRYPPGYVLKAKPHQRGYLRYSLNEKDMLAHRLVAMAFLGPPPSDRHEVAHDDGVRTNNNYRNLAWKLPLDNQADRKRHGTYLSGEQCDWTAKLRDTEAEAIKARYASGGRPYVGGSVTMQGLADEFGVSVAQISRIVNGKQRTHQVRPS